MLSSIVDEPLCLLEVSAHITVLFIINVDVHIIHFEERLIRRKGRSRLIFIFLFELSDPLFVVDSDVAAKSEHIIDLFLLQ